MEVTKSQWVVWKESAVTQEFIQRLFDKREMLKEGLAEGQVEAVDLFVGQCQAYKDAIAYALQDFEVVNDTDEEEEDGN